MNENKKSWEERSEKYGNDIKGVLYKSFPDSLNNHLHNRDKRILLDNIPNISNLRILDLGCGFGRNSMVLLERNKNIEILGVDISENYILQFKKNTNQKGICSSLEELSNEIGKFDYMICVATFMYVEDQNQEVVLKKLLSFLHESGEIILIEPFSSGQIFLNGFGILNKFNSNRKTTGGRFFEFKDLRKKIIKSDGEILAVKRIPITTIFILPLFLFSKVFNEKISNTFFKFISKLDQLVEKVNLPSISIAFVVKLKYLKKG